MSKIEEFRLFMHKINVDAFMLHTKDEYLDESTKLFNSIEIDGLLIVKKDDKCLFFTDGRYITQARSQLDQASFQVYDVQEENPCEWVKANLALTTSVGYYLQSFTVKEIREYEGICKLLPYSIKKEISHRKQIIVLHASGEGSRDKCKKVAKSMDKEVEVVLLTDPSSISWLLNLRNENARYTPCIVGCALLYKSGNVDLFIQDKVHSIVQENLDDHIKVFDISELESSLCKMNSIMVDPSTTLMSIMVNIQNKQVIERDDPCLIHKAIKNQIEITGTINAHIRDGVAVTNFLCWLENRIGNEVTELSSEEKILKYRKEQALFKQPSFPTISAFNENGAIIHYRADSKTNKAIQRDGLYLIDSGAQYLDGTTDVTRTVVIGSPTNEQIAYYTIVLKAHIGVASAIFPFGTTGGELEILARIHLWKFGIDYMHGTGHGVGSYLSVHEGPQAISKGNRVRLISGMILSNEPGYYIPGEYGIRIENLMCVERQENGFLSFKQLTSVPYDRKLINMQMLSQDEIKWINSYHQFVYKNLENSVKNKEWLRRACSSL